MLKITISRLPAATLGTPYRIHFEDEVLVERSFAAIHDAARRLVERGYDGPLEMYHEGASSPSRRVRSIADAARITVSEGEKQSVRFVKYKPFDRSIFA